MARLTPVSGSLTVVMAAVTPVSAGEEIPRHTQSSVPKGEALLSPKTRCPKVVLKRGAAATYKENGLQENCAMAPEIAREFGITLRFIRESLGITQEKLGELAQVNPILINEYERFRRPLNRRRLEYLLAPAGVPPERIAATLTCLEDNRAAARAPTAVSAQRRDLEAVVQKAGGLARDFTRGLLTLLTLEGEGFQARQQAQVLWERLKKHPAERRLLLVEDSRKFRTWALCERVAAESIEAAGEDPKEAVRLAQLALRIAELCPGPEAWRWRLEGYAGIHLANAHRAAGNLPPARAARDRAKKRWEAGAAADPGLLNEALVLQIEANLLRADRRFPEALKLIEEALRVDRSGITPSLLYTKAFILEGMDDLQGSTAALEEAASLVDTKRDPRLGLGIHLQFLLNLCLAGRAVEAQERLGEVRSIAERLNQELDLTRVLWLEALAAASVGQSAEAEARLRQVRRVMAERKIANDYALATLDLAVALLAENRTAEVRDFATDLIWIFRSQQMSENALAALRLFTEAARLETATVELARQIRRFLYRAQQDPELQLEQPGAGE
jgi:transcriptional regulator with XRE-family HTH domain